MPLRRAKGVRLVTLEPGDKLLSIARIVETDEEQAASAETVEEAPPSA
jgi:DNA gyrase subunit A